MEGCLERLGGVQRCVHGDGARTLSAIAKTCEDMLRDRGCTDVQVHVPPLVDEHGLLARGETRDGGAMRVYLCTDDRVAVKYARAVLEAQDANDARPIVVSIEGPTPFTRKECDRIQFFTAAELCVNVTKHCLVPRHERVAEPPSGVAREQLPRILETDRVVQYFGWGRGDVVRIRRVFGGHEPIVYYRVVAGA